MAFYECGIFDTSEKMDLRDGARISERIAVQSIPSLRNIRGSSLPHNLLFGASTSPRVKSNLIRKLISRLPPSQLPGDRVVAPILIEGRMGLDWRPIETGGYHSTAAAGLPTTITSREC